MKDSKVSSILKEAGKLTDRKFARELRVSTLYSMLKTADENILQHFKGTPADFSKGPEFYTAERGGKDDSDKIYGVGYQPRKKTDLSEDQVNRSLSTRYSPDRVGVQARRISDGVYQDPITNKVYDWNEGFTTEDGEKFEGGRVSLQTDLIYSK